jgi:hypothetical protein
MSSDDEEVLEVIRPPARDRSRDPENACQISVLNLRNKIVEGADIPVKKRASQYTDPRLRIIESVAYGQTSWSWKAGALASLVDEQKDAKKELKRQARLIRRRIEAAKAKRAAVLVRVAQRKKKAKPGKKTKRSPHVRTRKHSSSSSSSSGTDSE